MGMYDSVSSTMAGTMSTSSLKTVAELTVKAARASMPGTFSTELKFRLSKEKSIILWVCHKIMDLMTVAKRRYFFFFFGNGKDSHRIDTTSLALRWSVKSSI